MRLQVWKYHLVRTCVNYAFPPAKKAVIDKVHTSITQSLISKDLMDIELCFAQCALECALWQRLSAIKVELELLLCHRMPYCYDLRFFQEPDAVHSLNILICTLSITAFI